MTIKEILNTLDEKLLENFQTVESRMREIERRWGSHADQIRELQKESGRLEVRIKGLELIIAEMKHGEGSLPSELGIDSD